MGWFNRKPRTRKDENAIEARSDGSGAQAPQADGDAQEPGSGDANAAEGTEVRRLSMACPTPPVTIQVGRFAAHRPIFAEVTPAHLEAFQIPETAFATLYDGWFQLLRIHDETDTEPAIWNDGQALYDALRTLNPDLTRLTCMRWALLMSALSIFVHIDKEDAR